VQQLYVYRCNRQPNTYLFVTQKDNFNKLPTKLRKLLGTLSFSFEFKLNKDKKLMQTSAIDVLESIERNGFYLQLSGKTQTPKEDNLAQFYRR
jgi:uncharacterized protein YcgL (UPF0745 family)